jgi:tyrosine-protein phosphatase YwqE
MFNFFKKKDAAFVPGKLPFSLDIHSHILPGIDDGATDVEASVRYISALFQLGIRKSVATPHIIGDLYRNTPEIIARALEKTKAACIVAGIDIELSAAAEYMLDDYFLELLQKPEPLLTVHKNMVLTETSYASAPPNLAEIAAAIIAKGYVPILAHPERYHYYHRSFDKYRVLMDMGFVLQVNVLSLTGYYGKKTEKAARFIIENDLTTLIGTDLHHSNHLNTLTDEDNIRLFQKLLGNREYNNLDLL